MNKTPVFDLTEAGLHVLTALEAQDQRRLEFEEQCRLLNEKHVGFAVFTASKMWKGYGITMTLTNGTTSKVGRAVP